MPSLTAKSILLGAGRLVGAALLAAPAPAADDHYLREIEEEAKRQATTLTTSLPQPLPALVAPGSDAERLASGLDRAGFEQALREKLPKDSYAAYQRLDSAGKQRLYDSYRNDSRLAGIAEQIARSPTGKP